MLRIIFETLSVFCAFAYGVTGILCFLKAFHDRIIAKSDYEESDNFVFTLYIASMVFLFIKICVDDISGIELPGAINFYAVMTGIVLSGVYWAVDGDRWKK